MSVPKITLIHLFILEIQPGLELHDKSGNTHALDHAHTKIYQSTFIFHEFMSICGKSASNIISIQRYSSFKNPAI